MTHQEMADYLAEKLLGLELNTDKVSASQPIWVSANGGEMFSYEWHPQDDIGQCFGYIVPEMKKNTASTAIMGLF